jgi:hypothetical protein
VAFEELKQKQSVGDGEIAHEREWILVLGTRR